MLYSGTVEGPGLDPVVSGRKEGVFRIDADPFDFRRTAPNTGFHELYYTNFPVSRVERTGETETSVA